jgi:hypothetical protein
MREIPTLAKLIDKEQYKLGIKSGEILHKIHGLPAPNGSDNWLLRYSTVIEE